MRVASGRWLPSSGGWVVFLGLVAAATTALSAGPPAAVTTNDSTRGQSPPPYHYHVHYHFDAPPSWMYPSYHAPIVPGGPLTSFTLPGPWIPPTATQPYPPGYLVGPFTPLPFRDRNPQAPADKGIIEVFLPDGNADVYLNGQKMLGTGKTRKFTTPLLPLSTEYQYYVTASYKANGEMVTQYRKVEVGAGEYTVADFTRPALDNPTRLPSGPVDPNLAVPQPPLKAPPLH